MDEQVLLLRFMHKVMRIHFHARNLRSMGRFSKYVRWNSDVPSICG